MKNDSTLKEAGLKVTHPRIKILELLQSHPESHLSAEEIHNKLAKKEETIGLATIYRVLTQLEIAGLIQKNHFDDTQSTYEIKKQHHDHLICTNCGKIIEFVNMVDVVTYEFENIPFDTLNEINKLKPVLPKPSFGKDSKDTQTEEITTFWKTRSRKILETSIE